MRTPALIRDNPVLFRERRRFGRHWWVWLVVVLIAWVPLTITARGQIATGAVPAAWWQQLILLLLGTMLRPDVLLGFFLAWRAASEPAWQSLRDELSTTLLSARQLAIGKILVPVIILFILNAAAGIYYYGMLVINPEYQVFIPVDSEITTWQYYDSLAYVDYVQAGDPKLNPPNAPKVPMPNGFSPSPFMKDVRPMPSGYYFPAALPIGFLALVEDLFFALIIILIATKEYFIRRNGAKASALAFLRLTLVGILILIFSLVPMFAYDLVPLRWQDRMYYSPALGLLYTNAIWFALVLPLEFLLIAYFYKKLTRDFAKWLHGEIES